MALGVTELQPLPSLLQDSCYSSIKDAFQNTLSSYLPASFDHTTARMTDSQLCKRIEHQHLKSCYLELVRKITYIMLSSLKMAEALREISNNTLQEFSRQNDDEKKQKQDEGSEKNEGVTGSLSITVEAPEMAGNENINNNLSSVGGNNGGKTFENLEEVKLLCHHLTVASDLLTSARQEIW